MREQNIIEHYCQKYKIWLVLPVKPFHSQLSMTAVGLNVFRKENV